MTPSLLIRKLPELVPTEPLPPVAVIVTPDPNVYVPGVKGSRITLKEPLPKAIVPVPLMVCVPPSRRNSVVFVELFNVMVGEGTAVSPKVRPLLINKRRPFGMSMFASSVTLLSTPLQRKINNIL